MQEIISYFNNNSGAIIAATSVVTAVAIIFIAYFSYVSLRILRWEEEKDRRNRQPVLVLCDKITEDHRSLYIENIGYGPAMNIVRTIIQTGDVTKHCTSNEPLPLRPLGQGQLTDAYCATLRSITSVSIIDDPNFHVCIEYDDIFGNHYETRYRNRQHSIDWIGQRKIPWVQVGRI